MAYISDSEMQKLRRDIKNHYGVDIPEKITRVEFVNQSGGTAYMHTDDRFELPKPPQKQVEYLLHITEDGDTRALPFSSEQRLKDAFESFKRLDKYTLAATVDGEIKWGFTPQ